MARISILLTPSMMQAVERIQRVQPLATRATVMSTALEAGLLSLSNSMAVPMGTTKPKRRNPKESVGRLEQELEAGYNAAVDAPDLKASKQPEVTAAHVKVGSSPPGDPDWAFLDELAKDGVTVKANPFE